MPLKTLKRDTPETLSLEWILHVKNYKLTLDKDFCVGCQICTLACPKEAIRFEKQTKVPGEKANPAKIDIDLEKCNFCGICDVLCPFGATRITVNGEHLLSIIEKESFPQLIREIEVDPNKFPASGRRECEEACPLDLITVTMSTAEGKAVENIETINEDERTKLEAKIDIKKEHCPCCRVCEFKCPGEAVKVQKIFHGKMVIHQEKCPEDCRDCLDVCPITGALHLSDEDNKVYLDEMFCIYCGACKIVCPVEEALDLKRTSIRHTLVSSGAWNKALERLASPIGITKELRAKGSEKARESVEKRLGWRTA